MSRAPSCQGLPEGADRRRGLHAKEDPLPALKLHLQSRRWCLCLPTWVKQHDLGIGFAAGGWGRRDAASSGRPTVHNGSSIVHHGRGHPEALRNGAADLTDAASANHLFWQLREEPLTSAPLVRWRPHRAPNASGRAQPLAAIGQLRVVKSELPQPCPEGVASAIHYLQACALGVLLLQYLREVAIEDVFDERLRCVRLIRHEGPVAQLYPIAKEGHRQRHGGVITSEASVDGTATTSFATHYLRPVLLYHCVETFYARLQHLDVNRNALRRCRAGMRWPRPNGAWNWCPQPLQSPCRTTEANASSTRCGSGHDGRRSLLRFALDPRLLLRARDPSEAVLREKLLHLLDLPPQPVALCEHACACRSSAHRQLFGGLQLGSQRIHLLRLLLELRGEVLIKLLYLRQTRSHARYQRIIWATPAAAAPGPGAGARARASCTG
mmetsp:Transcript_124866/g.279082  ORF Transcript_124866/g.279082 Transcript_124866/m.279082 type:complete len:439 (-) Transcript_124866:399-1715(-)